MRHTSIYARNLYIQLGLTKEPGNLFYTFNSKALRQATHLFIIIVIHDNGTEAGLLGDTVGGDARRSAGVNG